MTEMQAEIVEPVREVVEVVEQGDRVVYVVEPTMPPAVPRVLADLDDVAPDAGSDGQVLTLVDGVWTPATGGGVGGGLTLAEVDALFPRTTEVAADLTAGLAGKENTGTAAAGMLTHLAASDPHPSYVRDGELGGLVAPLIADKSDVGHTHAIGDTTGLQATLDGKETAGTSAAAMAAHTAAADPHPQYLTTAEGDARFGNLFKEAEQDGRLDTLEARPVIDSPDDIGAATAVHTHAVSSIIGLETALDGKQPVDADLTAIAGLAPVDGSVLVRVVGAWSSRTNAQLKTDLVLTKGDVGLGNVDNTSDLGKPVSAAAQAALDAKAPTASPTFTGTLTTPRLITPPVTLVDAATIATDAALGNHFRVTLGGNRTLAAPTNPVDGQRALWEFIQDGAGGRTLALTTGTAGGFAFGTDVTAMTLSTAAGKRDLMGALYIAAVDRWLVIAVATGY